MQDFCHYAFAGMLVAAFTESEIVRTRTLPLIQSILRDEPSKLDFLNESIAIWHNLSKVNEKKTPGQYFIDQLNVLDSIDEIDPFTKYVAHIISITPNRLFFVLAERNCSKDFFILLETWA